MTAGLTVVAATRERWRDLEALFGQNGAMAGCWCMWWRESAAEFKEKAGEPNRRALKRLVASERPPGLLAYRDGEPVGWCAVAPRPEYGRIERSPTLGTGGGDGVWAVPCFYIRRGMRGRGIGSALLRAAVEHARAAGARALEGYPMTPGERRPANSDAYTGVLSMFEREGFRRVPGGDAGRRIVVRRDLA